MKPTTLVHRLRRMNVEMNDRVRCITWGGCAVFAVILGRKLETLGYKPVVLVAMRYHPTHNDQPVSIDYIRERIHNNEIGHWNAGGLRFNHVGLQLPTDAGTFVIDSDRVKLMKDTIGDYRGKIVPGHLTLDEMETDAWDDSMWNPDFNRQQIPLMEQIINKHFDR